MRPAAARAGARPIRDRHRVGERRVPVALSSEIVWDLKFLGESATATGQVTAELPRRYHKTDDERDSRWSDDLDKFHVPTSGLPPELH